MTSPPSSALPLFEIAQILTCVACTLTNALTLKDAVLTRHRVVCSGENHGAQVWSWINVRNKACFVLVQIVFLAWGIDRLVMLSHDPIPAHPTRWVIYGFARTTSAALIAFTGWANMRAFKTLRDGVE